MTDFAVDVHIFFIVVIFFMIVRNLYLVLSETDFVKMAKKIKFITPAFHGMIAAILYSGITIQFFYRDFTSISIYFMIAATIFIMVAEIKRYKKMKGILSTDLNKQEEFRAFAKKIYFIDLAIIIAIYILGAFSSL
jgi:hypothetical protein